MIGAYFGEAARRWLDNEIYEGFKRVGGGLEALVRRATADSQVAPEELSSVEEGITRLNDRVYRLGSLMMTRLRDGQVGRRAPDLGGPARTLDHGGS
jgi:hypothetical protein